MLAEWRYRGRGTPDHIRDAGELIGGDALSR